MVTNQTNGSSVSVLRASSEQVAMLHGDRSANSTNEMTVICEGHSALALEGQWAVGGTGP